MVTRAQIEAQAGDAIKCLDDTRLYYGVNGTNLLGDIDTFEQSLIGNFVSDKEAAIAAYRALHASASSDDTAAAVILPHLREYAQFAASPNVFSGKDALIDDIVQYFYDNTLRVKSRNITYGSMSAISGSSATGIINRLNVDDHNFNIESCYVDAKSAKCVADEHSGAPRHQEVFEFRGAAPSRDRMIVTGSGAVKRISALSAANSLVLNSSFSDHSGTTGSAFSSSTFLTSWTVGSSAANFTPDSANTYRDFVGDTNPPWALRIGANDSITQDFNVRNVNVNPKVPLYVQIAYNRQVGSGDGTLTLTLGSKTASVALSAQTGWNILRIAIGQNNWLRQWNKVNPTIKIDLASRSTGYVLVDDLIVAPFTEFDGLWYAVVGGATQFVKDDSFTWTDSFAGSDSKIQQWMWRGFRRYLPHSTSGSAITWADP